MADLLQVRDLTVRFRHSDAAAVARVNFDLNAGEGLGVLGESGAGKTTLVRTLLGVLRADEAELQGSVRFRGTDILRANEHVLRKIRGANISLISQEPELGLNPFIRVGEQVAEVLRAHTNLNRRQRQEQAHEMLAATGLYEREAYRAYPHQLSGGQRQRVVIAQALVCKPTLLIADEPTSALDNVIQAQILNLMEDLKRRLKLALMFITHDATLLTGLADRVLVMRAGAIIEAGTLQQICSAPQDPYTQSLLKFRPLPAG